MTKIIVDHGHLVLCVSVWFCESCENNNALDQRVLFGEMFGNEVQDTIGDEVKQ